LFRNPTAAVNSLKIIITNAFDFKTAFIGTMSHGITRGLYSNESGLGTGGVLAAESGDKNTVLSSLASMTTAFWDTVVMCALTGVVFVTYGADKGLNSDLIMKNAFNSVVFGSAFLSVSMSLFVFATVIGWYYIAKRALVFLSGRTAVYDFLYISFLFFGAVINSDLLWTAADAVNIALLLPSVYAIIKLSDKINLYIKDK
ncbi:MAG: alanine:cation symporter family protein, partial [Clostridia bacterium]|nr:alanine:cation symporter family protein [Clostridia bacterium]